MRPLCARTTKNHPKIEIGNPNDNTSIQGNLFAQSELNITENRIALIEHDIERKKIVDVDYSNAYDRVEETMGKLRNAISDETKEVWSNNKDVDWVRSELEDTYHDILVNDFRDVLYRFYK